MCVKTADILLRTTIIGSLWDSSSSYCLFLGWRQRGHGQTLSDRAIRMLLLHILKAKGLGNLLWQIQIRLQLLGAHIPLGFCWQDFRVGEDVRFGENHFLVLRIHPVSHHFRVVLGWGLHDLVRL